MAILSCFNPRTASFTHIKAARNKCLNLKIKITFLLKYPVCAINRATFFTFEWFNPVVAEVGQITLGGYMRFFGGYRKMLFCIMKDHCAILRVIRHNCYLD